MLKAGAYPWCTVDTAVNLREVRMIARENLKAKVIAQKLTFEGHLNDADLAAIDAILRKSKLIAPAILRRILPH